MKKYAIGLSLILAACGGGGGGDDTPAPVVASPAGVYEGTSTDGKLQVGALVDESSKLSSISIDVATAAVVEMTFGTVTFNGTTYTGSGTAYKVGLPKATSAISGTYASGTSTVTTTSTSATTTVTGAADASYATPVALIAGYHDGYMTSFVDGLKYRLSAKFNGTAITADMSCGCNFSGTLTASGKDYTNVVITMDAGPPLRELTVQKLSGPMITMGAYYVIMLKNDAGDVVASVVLDKPATTTPAVVLTPTT